MKYSFCILIFLFQSVLISFESFAQLKYLQKAFGEVDEDNLVFVQPTFDGGYIFAGYTDNFGAGSYDYYLVKTDAAVQIEWSKIYGGPDWDFIMRVQQTADSGYVMVGYTWSFGAGQYDAYVVKTDVNGDEQWSKTYGGADIDYGHGIIQTMDGGYMITGSTQSFGAGSEDVYMIKTDADGNTEWTKTYGGTSLDYGNITYQTADSGYVVVGTTYGLGAGNSDVFLLRTDVNGGFLWSKAYGGASFDNGISFRQTPDGGYIICGYTESFGEGNTDAYVIKTDSTGNLEWSKTYGGQEQDDADWIELTDDGGYILSGYTASFGGGNGDAYLIKLDMNGNPAWTKAYGGQYMDVGKSVLQTPDGGFIITGTTKSFGPGDYDGFVIKTDASGNTVCNEFATATVIGNPATVVNSPSPAMGSGASTSDQLTVVNNAVTIEDIQCATCADTQAVCIITVDSSSTRNVIVWEKPVSTSIDSFRIYREIIGVYTHVGSVAYSALSEFVDNTYGINPQVTSYRYRISVLDTCGYESVLSNYHETMHVTASQGSPPPSINLVWDAYEGFPVSYYRILRDSTGTGNFEKIDSVSYTNFTYTDQYPPVASYLLYMIEVVHPTGCVATLKGKNYNSSKSNTTIAAGTGIDESQVAVPMVQVYPNPNSGVFTVKMENGKGKMLRLPGGRENVKLMVSDVLGREIYQSVVKQPQSEIYLSGSPPGVYHLQVITDELMLNTKFIIK
ncbi:MAG: T9SS type A sorting domain-containing protein [Bacteroidota bacterium]